MVFFDTETSTDHLQNLIFGNYRYCRVDEEGLHVVEEGLLYQDDLEETDPKAFAQLRRYVESHPAATERPRELTLLSRSDFVERVFYRAGYELRARIVGFNLPFDIARLAIGVEEGRGTNFGGFSFILWPGAPGSGHKERRHRPRVNVKSLDSKGAFISFSKSLGTKDDDLIPDESSEGLSDPTYGWRGRFLDLATFAFALTGVGHSLDSACRAFDVEGKADPGEHGQVTEHYIDYCRQDVAATMGLYEALMAEFRLHPIPVAPEKAFSPASISKGYLTAMGITPLLDRHPDFPRDVLGYAMSGFFGGRAECRIRRVPVPVALVDFMSMYPLVDTLLDLYQHQIAEHLEVEDATEKVQKMLDAVTLNDCFDGQFWSQLVGFALVEPDGDVLPVRAPFNEATFNIGVTPLTSDEPLWYSLADCGASKILTGRTPKIQRAVRLVAQGRTSRLRSVKVRSVLDVDPFQMDPMAAMTEERQRVKHDSTLDDIKRGRLTLALKNIVNAGSYGIYSEFNARERRQGETTPVQVHGRKEPFTDRVTAPEDAGKYCFPPFASCITGSARLMLAMLERSVTDLGGSWAFCDTDSMAIVATKEGGLVTCPVGAYRLPDGTEAVRALSFAEVESIRGRFNDVNPFNPFAVPEILKLEAKAMCLAISVKRYALYHLDVEGAVIFLDDHPPSENGLGHFLNPDDPGSPSKEWIKDVWRIIIAHVYDLQIEPPHWLNRPTMVRTTVTSTPVQRAFRHMNKDAPYAQQVKPFNFMLSAAGAKPPAGVTIGAPFRLVASYEPDARKWEELRWVDVHSPESGSYSITTKDGRPGMARVDTFADVVAKYETHPEAKSLGPDGRPCGRLTAGLLQRRLVTVGEIVLIGKEANRLEERSLGELSVNDRDQRLTIYQDDDGWKRLVMPALRKMGTKRVAELAGVSERRVRDWFSEAAVPHKKTRDTLHKSI